MLRNSVPSPLSFSHLTTNRSLGSRSGGIFQGEGHAHAAADAKRGRPKAGFALEHLVQQGDGDASPGAANGVAEGDGAAIYIQTAAVEVQFPVTGQNLGGKGFIELDNFEVVNT